MSFAFAGTEVVYDSVHLPAVEANAANTRCFLKLSNSLANRPYFTLEVQLVMLGDDGRQTIATPEVTKFIVPADGMAICMVDDNQLNLHISQ